MAMGVHSETMYAYLIQCGGQNPCTRSVNFRDRVTFMFNRVVPFTITSSNGKV
jgi:hypothetical protein